MIIEKVITATIKVTDPIGICADPERKLLMQTLNAIYVGKCLSDCKVLDILAVEKVSQPTVNYDGDLNTAQMTVVFVARVVTYHAGDVVVGVNVLDASIPSTLVCKFDHGHCVIMGDERAATLSVGQRAIVRVTDIRYQFMSSNIVIGGSMYTAERRNVVFAVASPYEATDEVALLRGRASELKAAIEKMDGVARMRELFLTWKKPVIPHGAKKLPIMELEQMPEYVCFDNREDVFDGVVYGYDTALFPGDYELVEGKPAVDIMVIMLTSYIGYLEALRDAVTLYRDDVYNQHENMWTVMRNMRV